MQKKVFAFDLDGTLTEYRTWITDENLALLDGLREQGIRLLIVGAGRTKRIFTQMKKYPLEILGNYGLQYAVYREDSGDIEFLRDLNLPCDVKSVTDRINLAREKFGYTDYRGETCEIHPTGCVTFPLLGTKADIGDKLAFDPDKKKRHLIYPELAEIFSDYNVFVGGSTSFDMVPKPFDKLHALDLFCTENGYTRADVTYFGDDYEIGGNDEPILKSDVEFIKVDKPDNLVKIVTEYIK